MAKQAYYSQFHDGQKHLTILVYGYESWMQTAVDGRLRSYCHSSSGPSYRGLVMSVDMNNMNNHTTRMKGIAASLGKII